MNMVGKYLLFFFCLSFVDRIDSREHIYNLLSASLRPCGYTFYTISLIFRIRKKKKNCSDLEKKKTLFICIQREFLHY